MGVGPVGSSGRDQLAAVRAFVTGVPEASRDVVLVACRRGAGNAAREEAFDGAPVLGVECAGHLHTSVVEYLVRSGFGGVLIGACPPRGCWSQEGPKWLEQRLYHDREAELQARVDRRRIRVIHGAVGERDRVRRALRDYRADVERLAALEAESDIDVLGVCEATGEEVAS